MAQLKEGSIIKKSTGNEIIATETQLNNHNTDAAAHNDIRQQINTLDAEVVAHKAEIATQDKAGHIKLSDIPTKVSQLENDRGYVTQEELGDAGYGDMLKAVYDTNNDGIVDNADKLDGKHASDFASASHTHTFSEITDFNEATQDAIGAILTDTSTIDFTYDDTNNQIKADVKPNSSNQKVAVSKNSRTPTGTRKQINFKDGTNISVTVADNATNDAVDVTITNTYTHPTGDGNLHVPATGTTNNNKVLKAGSTAGSLSWGNVDWSELTNKPSSSVSSIDNAVTNSHTHSNKALLDTYTQTEANLADAVSKKHAQNTDNTLTSSSSNTINTTGTGNIVDFKVNNTTKSSIDNNGNFTGKSASADKLATARTISLSGDVTGSASFDGSGNISINATVVDDSHNHTSINYKDTHSINHNGFDYKGVSMHLKYNTTDGLSDGGTYHGVLHLTQWGDISGGKPHQLGFTDNGNIWYRNWNGSAWSSWVKIAKMTDITIPVGTTAPSNPSVGSLWIDTNG